MWVRDGLSLWVVCMRKLFREIVVFVLVVVELIVIWFWVCIRFVGNIDRVRLLFSGVLECEFVLIFGILVDFCFCWYVKVKIFFFIELKLGFIFIIGDGVFELILVLKSLIERVKDGVLIFLLYLLGEIVLDFM